MKKGNRIRVSIEMARRTWERVKNTVEYAHLAEFILHAGHSDVLTLLIFALKWPAGWLILGWVLAAYFYLRLRSTKPMVPANWKSDERDHRYCKPARPEQRNHRRRKGKKSKKSR